MAVGSVIHAYETLISRGPVCAALTTHYTGWSANTDRKYQISLSKNLSTNKIRWRAKVVGKQWKSQRETSSYSKIEIGHENSLSTRANNCPLNKKFFPKHPVHDHNSTWRGSVVAPGGQSIFIPVEPVFPYKITSRVATGSSCKASKTIASETRHETEYRTSIHPGREIEGPQKPPKKKSRRKKRGPVKVRLNSSKGFENYEADVSWLKTIV